MNAYYNARDNMTGKREREGERVSITQKETQHKTNDKFKINI